MNTSFKFNILIALSALVFGATTAAAECPDGLTYEGVCDANTLYFCENDEAYYVECEELNAECGYNPADGYDCFTIEGGNSNDIDNNDNYADDDGDNDIDSGNDNYADDDGDNDNGSVSSNDRGPRKPKRGKNPFAGGNFSSDGGCVAGKGPAGSGIPTMMVLAGTLGIFLRRRRIGQLG